MLFDKCGAKYQAIGQKNDPQTFQESRSFLERRKKKKTCTNMAYNNTFNAH
jgi:hypothetical protein